MGYNGSATITFHVERVKGAEGKWTLPKEDDEDNVEELELEIYGRSYFQPGRSFGPPENCYPDEGDTEIEVITLDGQPWNGELTDREEERALSQLDEAVREDDGPEPDDYDDDDYEPRSYDFTDY